MSLDIIAYAPEEAKKIKDKKSGTWGEEIAEFLNFWQKSSEQKLQWEFC